jgi:hypothetical protein
MGPNVERYLVTVVGNGVRARGYVRGFFAAKSIFALLDGREYERKARIHRKAKAATKRAP